MGYRFRQKLIFRANWLMRESAVVPTFPVAVPIVERVLAKAPLAKVTFGSDHWGWLKAVLHAGTSPTLAGRRYLAKQVGGADVIGAVQIIARLRLVGAGQNGQLSRW